MGKRKSRSTRAFLYLSEEVKQALRLFSAHINKSMSQVITEAVRIYLLDHLGFIEDSRTSRAIKLLLSDKEV